MQQIKLISKLGLAVIAITALSAAVAVQAFYHFSYFTQSSDAQAQELPVPVPPPNVPLNSVATQHIIDGQVMTQDLANENVTTAKIKNGEVKSADIGDQEVKYEDIARHTIQVTSFFQPDVPFPPNRIPVGGDGVSKVFCTGETEVTGGGYEVLYGTLEIRENRPIQTLERGPAWQVIAHNSGLTEGEVRAWAVCAAEFP